LKGDLDQYGGGKGMSQVLFHVSLKPFEPLTAGDNRPERKIALVKTIQKNGDLDSARDRCRGKRIFVDVNFYLFSKTAETGRY
jgi:hypothetical protein